MMDATDAIPHPPPPSAAVVRIIDDDKSVRTALTRLLGAAGLQSRAYGSAAEFLVADPDDTPGCIVLDIGLPGMTGMQMQAAIAKREPTLPIIFLTGRGDIATSVQAMKAGAVDYLTKPVKREPLLAAITVALERDRERRALQNEQGMLLGRLRSLTPREREVFELVVRGTLNKRIADQLGTSIRTVKAHRARVMLKMHAASIADLVRVADQLVTTDKVAR